MPNSIVVKQVLFKYLYKKKSIALCTQYFDVICSNSQMFDRQVVLTIFIGTITQTLLLLKLCRLVNIRCGIAF